MEPVPANPELSQHPVTVDFEALRADFPIFTAGSQPLHYLDSAASAQKPTVVIESIRQCYSHEYGPVHRGLYPLAENASEHYEGARRKIAKFINARRAQQIVQDKDDNPVFMAPSSYMLDLERRNNPEITFHTTSEFKTDIDLVQNR